MKHIICFGDSITRGENDHVNGGWVDRLKTYCIQAYLESRQDEICTFNMGIGGEDTNGLIRRFKDEFDARLLLNGETIVTFGYGANDLAIVDNDNKVNLSKYYSNLVYCIKHAQSRNASVYLINIIPVEKSMQLVGSKERRTADITTYNNMLNFIAKEQNSKVIDVFSCFKTDLPSLYTFDGVHPNSEGHRIMFEEIRKALF